MSLKISVVTPEKVFLIDEAQQIILPSISGRVGVLTGHAPFVTILKPGLVRYEDTTGLWVPAVIYGGFAEVINDKITILVNGAEEVKSFNDLDDVQLEMVDLVEKFQKLKMEGLKGSELDLALSKMQIAQARVFAIEYVRKNYPL